MTKKTWIGNAQAVQQVDRLTPTSVGLGDKFQVTINGKVFEYVAKYDDLVVDETYGYLPALCVKLVDLLTTFGETYAEFAEITWVADTDSNAVTTSILAYGPIDGKPVTITSAAVNVSGGMEVRTEETVIGTASVNEQQTITILGVASGGTFTVSYNGVAGTGTVAYNAAAATLQTELETIAALTGNVTVTGSAGGPWTVEFGTGLALTNVPLIICNGASLTGANTQTFSRSSVTAASGPNWFTAAANWSTGTSPADNDELVFENSSVSCLYGLSNPTITPASVTIRASYTGAIGLPRNAGLYAEYRDTALRIGANGDGASPTITIRVGGGEGQGSGLIRLDTGDKQTILSVSQTASSIEQNSPALNWVGTHASNVVNVSRGSVGVAYFADQSATVATLKEGWVSSQDMDSAVYFGSGATIGAVIKSGGDLQTEASITSFSQTAGTASVNGSASLPALVVSGGTVYANTTGVLGKYGAITAITKADPAVVSSATHGLAPGDKIRISGSDMAEVNYRDFTVGVVPTAGSFQLLDEDSSGYAAVGTTGTWAKLESVLVTGEGMLNFDQSMEDRQLAAPLVVYNRNSWSDRAKSVTTLTYPTGQFAVDYRGCSPSDSMGEGLWIRS